MPSKTPPPPSRGADTEVSGAAAGGRPEMAGGHPGTVSILAAADVLSRRGVFGLAWLDDHLNVMATYGRLAEFVPVGLPVAKVLLPLAGMEDDIRQLADQPGAAIELPAVQIVNEELQLPRLNLLVVHIAPQRHFLVTISRPSNSVIEAELAKQMRARLIAEAEVKAKSKELARINAELSLANRDLEDFASIISHDLGAPMRAMADLTRRLEVEIGGGAGSREDAAVTVQGVKDLTRRLSTMLRDLHEYSSIGRKQDAVESIDTGALIAEIVHSIPRPTEFRIAIAGTWPRIKTLAAPLDIVLRNLVDNAVKHHDRADGQVTITAVPAAEHLTITVADDGPGIGTGERTAAFMPFRTLAPKGDGHGGRPAVGGTGMGLAFVKRTVETVGGTLDLTSTPEIPKGTIFRVAWPMALLPCG